MKKHALGLFLFPVKPNSTTVVIAKSSHLMQIGELIHNHLVAVL